MKIYTKTGDNGTTSLYDGQRVAKNSLRIEAVGELDELISFIGVARCYCCDIKTAELLKELQLKLFKVGSEIATPDSSTLKSVVSESDWKALETKIDSFSEKLEKFKAFTLPGDNPQSAHIHVCRSVCRRLERTLVTISQNDQEKLSNHLLTYINRLSDLFYALACYSEENTETVDI